MTEQWVKIDDRGFYEVSNFGRVRSMPRAICRKGYRNTYFRLSGRMLKPGISKQLGYPIVILCLPEGRRTEYVHTLVMEAFGPDRTIKLWVTYVIDHKDDNTENNHFKNLQWLPHGENIQKGKRHRKKNNYVLLS